MATRHMATSTSVPTMDGGSPLVGIDTGSSSKVKLGGALETRGAVGVPEVGVELIGLVMPTMV